MGCTDSQQKGKASTRDSQGQDRNVGRSQTAKSLVDQAVGTQSHSQKREGKCVTFLDCPALRQRHPKSLLRVPFTMSHTGPPLTPPERSRDLWCQRIYHIGTCTPLDFSYLGLEISCSQDPRPTFRACASLISGLSSSTSEAAMAFVHSPGAEH